MAPSVDRPGGVSEVGQSTHSGKDGSILEKQAPSIGGGVAIVYQGTGDGVGRGRVHPEFDSKVIV